MMLEIILTIRSAGLSRQINLSAGKLSLGRGKEADLCLDDRGLSRLHASIHREGDQVWLVDHGSTNGSFVNGQPAPAFKTYLKHGDLIELGDQTAINIGIRSIAAASNVHVPVKRTDLPRAPLIAIAVIIALGAAAVAVRGWWRTPPPPGRQEVPTQETPGDRNIAGRQGEVVSEIKDTVIAVNRASPTPGNLEGGNSFPESTNPQKLYLQGMSKNEQTEFVKQQAQRVGMMIGNRPAQFPDVALNLIKRWVDAYAQRVGNNSTRIWGEDLRFLFKRATGYTPLIIRSFRAQGVPSVVGVYLPMIETEYRNIATENHAGAMGLFQFIPDTARRYGLDPADRTDPQKMAPAAARYMSDRLSEFGTDATGVGLAIAGYNRNPDNVRKNLHQLLLLQGESRGRSFWDLVANKSEFDKYFQSENSEYVPRFFAFAIIGENPWNFGIRMNPLSTYTQ